MVYCIKCGNELLPDANYCHRCGSEVISLESSKESRSSIPYESTMAEMYYEFLRPAAKEKTKDSSVEHRDKFTRPLS